MKAQLLIVFGLVFVLLFGCINLDVNQNNGGADNGENGEDGNGATELSPTFSVLYPSQGAKIKTVTEDTEVEVLLQTLDITLVAPSSSNVYGQGHFSIALDNGEPQIVVASTYVFEDVSLGEHTINIEFVNNDGSSYDPQMKETIYFSVELKEGVVIKPAEYAIDLENGVFDPAEITVKQGDLLVFTNQEAMPHAILITKLPKKTHVTNSEALQTGETFNYTLSDVGEYEYSSLTIPTITGKVTVIEK